jgi:hypothetical protein
MKVAKHMKSFLFSLVALMLFVAAGAQGTSVANEPLQFKETEYNFGKIAQSKPVFHLFSVVNTSTKAIKIDDVVASCGCTTPEWSRDEIAPGGKTDIKIGYNAAAEGTFNKTITVNFAGQTKVLRIKGEVWKAPATSAPGNASVELLKSKLASQTN